MLTKQDSGRRGNPRRSFKLEERAGQEPANLATYGNEIPARLVKYHQPQELPPVEIRCETYSTLPGLEAQFLRRYCPWGQQLRTRKDAGHLAARYAAVLQGFWFNTAFSNPAWNRNFFHWHRNVLTHLALLISEGFSDIRVIVEQELADYKRESLLALGIDESRWLPVPKVLGRTVENLVSVHGLDRNLTSAKHDYVRPEALTELGKQLSKGMDLAPVKRDLNLYVRRGDVPDRRVVNEREVIDFLQTRGHYRAVDLSKLQYREQAVLFNRAQFIVGMHGGGLTNLLFARNPWVLELAASGHGWRPDFFPFANGSEGFLAQVGLRSENLQNDISIPLGVLEWWLRLERLDENSFFSPDYAWSDHGH